MKLNEEMAEGFAELIAAKVAAKLFGGVGPKLVGRDELSRLAGVSKSTIDRYVKGGYWVTLNGVRTWRETEVRLSGIKRGTRLLFDRDEALRVLSGKSEQN